jgi:nucleoside-diphosphate-sugar epimerase
VNVEGLRSLLEAARTASLHRFIHVSSLGVYAAKDHHGTDESAPLPDRHMDGYTQSKVEAERLATEYQLRWQVPLGILRPGFVYGPRDRTVLPRLADLLQRRQVVYLGDRGKVMNTTYVGNLVDAIFLAIACPAAVGQTYNLTDDEPVSKQRFLEAIADLAGLERPAKTIPLAVAQPLAWLMDRMFKLLGKDHAPRLTPARIKLMGRNLHFSVEKAKRELGYQPRVKFEEGVEEAVTWWKTHRGAAHRPAPAEAIPEPAEATGKTGKS